VAAEPAVAVAAIVAIAILILAVLPIGILTSRTTSTYFTTSIIIAGTATLTNFASGQLYDVTFNEGRGCGGYIDEWGVQLGNLTITQPPGTQLSQIPTDGYNSTGKFDLTTIVFYVPSGSYPFTVYPTAFLRPPSNDTSIVVLRGWSGILTVTNSSLTIDTLSGEVCT
jgi:hypothetical protein